MTSAAQLAARAKFTAMIRAKHSGSPTPMPPAPAPIAKQVTPTVSPAVPQNPMMPGIPNVASKPGGFAGLTHANNQPMTHLAPSHHHGNINPALKHRIHVTKAA